MFQNSTTFSASFFVLQIFAEVMPGTCKENNKLSELETRSTDAKFLLFVRVEIETTPDKRWQSEARQKEKQSKKPMPKEFKKIKKYKDPFYWAAFILLDAID